MRVTVDSKKALKTNLKVFVDKKTIEEKIGIRLAELSKTVSIKGISPGRNFSPAYSYAVLRRAQVGISELNLTNYIYSIYIFLNSFNGKPLK